jgi:hypothetical protein
MDKKEADRLMGLMPNRKFCPAPFLHTYINANNRGYKLCCMSHIVDRWDTQKSLKEQHESFWTGDIMKGIRQEFLEGKMPEACDWWCGRIEREEIFHKSDRLNFIQRFEREFSEDHMTPLKEIEWCIEHGSLTFRKPVDVDLRPSKLCNLKCRSCNSLWSNKIEEEVLANPEIQKWSHWDMVTQSKGSMERAKQIDWNDPNFDVISNLDMTNVVKLAMSGGETLIDPRVHQIIEKIVKNNQAKNMRLHFITNCTSLPSRIYELITEFKAVTFNISIDGIGKTDEYLRHGTRWDRKVDVFHKIFTLPNLHWAGVMHVFQPISAFQVKKNVEWFLKQSRRYPEFGEVTFNPIVDPWYLSVSWLDDDHKDWVRSQVQECIDEFYMTKREIRWFDWLHSELNKSQGDRAIRYANDFVRAELALNKIRGTNTLEIEPMLQRYFDRYDPSNITPSEHGRPAAQFDGKPKPTANFDGKS